MSVSTICLGTEHLWNYCVKLGGEVKKVKKLWTSRRKGEIDIQNDHLDFISLRNLTGKVKIKQRKEDFWETVRTFTNQRITQDQHFEVNFKWMA